MAGETASGATVRLRLDLAYDGCAFAGWAAQPGRRTVEGTLAEALAVAVGDGVRLVVAGRTDSGVHAVGQVAHCDVTAEGWRRLAGGAGHAVDPERAVRRLAGLLPRDVRVWSVAPAPPGFDARFAAEARGYCYRVSDHPGGPSPLRRHDTLAWRRRLDVAAMQQAAVPLVGLHDYVAFCRPRPGATTIRTLHSLTVVRRTGTDPVVEVDVAADAFCHHMVRALVGALLSVGAGTRAVDWPAAVLDARRRDSGVLVVPPHGLTLVAVHYPAPEHLAGRVAEARRMRSATEVDKVPAMGDDGEDFASDAESSVH